jgi:hypothetical protein
VFAVRVPLGRLAATPEAPAASDNAPATPNTATAFVRPLRFELLRFEFRLPCDMVEASHFASFMQSLNAREKHASDQKADGHGI